MAQAALINHLHRDEGCGKMLPRDEVHKNVAVTKRPLGKRFCGKGNGKMLQRSLKFANLTSDMKISINTFIGLFPSSLFFFLIYLLFFFFISTHLRLLTFRGVIDSCRLCLKMSSWFSVLTLIMLTPYVTHKQT